MVPRNLSRADLVDFTTNAATGVASGKVTGFLAAQNTAISDALTDANAVLAAANLAAVEARAASEQATFIAVEAQNELLQQLSDLKFNMRGVESPGGDYEALGFDAPDTVRSTVEPQRPTELSATGFSYGENQLSWRGNNASGSVTYVIECKIGDTAPYAIVGTCTAQKFTHTGVTPGQFYQYHVRAQAARNRVSPWSDEVVVYGLLTP